MSTVLEDIVLLSLGRIVEFVFGVRGLRKEEEKRKGSSGWADLFLIYSCVKSVHHSTCLVERGRARYGHASKDRDVRVSEANGG